MNKLSLNVISARIAKLQAEFNERVAAGEVPEAQGVTAAQLTPDVSVVRFVAGKTKDAEGKVTGQIIEQGTVLGVSKGEKGGTVVKVFVSAGVKSRVASPFLSQIVEVVAPAADSE